MTFDMPDMLKSAHVGRIVLGLCLMSGSVGVAQSAPLVSGAEQRTVRAFEAASKNPLELRVFLQGMPKGGDLHLHLSGGTVYSETLIRDAVQDGLCVKTATMTLFKPQDSCGEGAVPAGNALKDQNLYDSLVNAFSMRNFVPSSGISGHDQFFSTFDRFQALGIGHVGEWVDEITTRAAEQNEQYIEAMYTPSFSNATKLGYQIGWSGDSVTDLKKTRDALLGDGLREEIVTDRKELDEIGASRAQREHCGQTQAKPACSVKVLYLFQVLRGFPPQQVFAQTLLGFELASVDPRVVGLNFVMPEDGYLSMRDYHLQMMMLDYLHSIYPKIRITLHAGELAPGLVPPDGLKFHIREAVGLGHAERIGHGVDVMYEDRPHELLQELAAKHIMVEINLTSNDVILNIKGKDNPLSVYRAAHVPLALSTDDEGVSRIDITHEYEKGVDEQGLGYLDLKNMARTSLEHAFIPGESLWAAPDNFIRRKPACAGPIAPKSNPAPACAALLKSSDRAAAQWELERRFAIFESSSH
jgi:adenosine deaminase